MPDKTIKQLGNSTENSFRLFRNHTTHLRSMRHWKILSALTWLHFRYFFFHTQQLERLKMHGLVKHRVALPQLEPTEFAFANRWNLKISNMFRAMRAPYARCMKRCFVIAHLMPRSVNLYLVMGVLTDNIYQGHAWLELNGQIVADKFDSITEPFHEVVRIPIRHESR